MREREAQRPARVGHADPHRQQHVAGLGDACGTRRTRRALDTVGVEQHQQRIPFAARERHVHVAGQSAIVARPVGGRSVDREQHVEQAIPHRCHLRQRLVECVDRPSQRGSQSDDPRYVLGARSQIPLVTAAVEQRNTLDVAAEKQRAASVRSTELVPGNTHRREPAAREVDGDVTGGLHGVGMDGNAELDTQRRDLAHRLDRPDFVVGPHHRDQCRLRCVLLEFGTHVRDRHRTVGVDRDHDEFGVVVVGQPLRGVEHGVMLDGGHHESTTLRVSTPACPVDALDRQVVGLGAAAGEDHFRRPRAECRRNGLAGFLEVTPGTTTRTVQRRRVTRLQVAGGHRLECLRQQSCRRGIVEVDRGAG